MTSLLRFLRSLLGFLNLRLIAVFLFDLGMSYIFLLSMILLIFIVESVSMCGPIFGVLSTEALNAVAPYFSLDFGPPRHYNLLIK